MKKMYRGADAVLPDFAMQAFLLFAGNLGLALGFQREPLEGRMNTLLGIPSNTGDSRRLHSAIVKNAFRWKLHPRRRRWWRLADEAKMVGMENVITSMELGQGLILVASHLGPSPIIPKIDHRLPCKANLITQIYTAHSDFDDTVRCRFVRRAIATLDKGGVVILMGDGMFGLGGEFVPFFDGQALFALGFAKLAVRCGAPVIPVFCEQEERACQVSFQEPLTGHESKGPQEASRHLLQKYVQRLEEFVRQHPDQAPRYFMNESFTKRTRLFRSTSEI